MATVFIWNNNLISTVHSVIGHASLSITDTWSQVQYASLDSYVSFWPSSTSRHADPNPNFFHDLEMEKYAPNHIIRLNGLDTMKMLAKWSDIRNKKGVHYKFVRKNCATIAARVLKKGSKKGGFNRHNMIWTPLDVKRLALDLGGQTMTWDNFVTELRGANAIDWFGENQLRDCKRRDQCRGSSQAAARFVKGVDTDTNFQPIGLSELKFDVGGDLNIPD